MSYLVIARKFRPQTFQAIVGQEHVTRALSNAIARNRIPHALLFTGPRGVGKTSAARVFARALNCQSPLQEDGFIEPCGKCANCIEIAKSTSLAVREIDGASNNSVDNVRELIDSLHSLPPPGSKFKIYIIDEVHMLSVAAFNALLKSLEEPPPNTIFIFATTEPHKIPETVISRCQRHDFRSMPAALIAEQLRAIVTREKLKVEDAVFLLIARNARGSMRDAQSMLERLLAFAEEALDVETAQRLFGVLDASFYFRLSKAIFSQDVTECFRLIDEAFHYALDLRSFAGDFLTHWRNLLVVKFSQKSSTHDAQFAEILQLSEEELSDLRQQIEAVSSFDLQRLFDLAEKTVSSALGSVFSRYVFEAGIAKMATLPSLKPIPEILDSLEKLSQSSISGSVSPSATRGIAAKSTTSSAHLRHAPTEHDASSSIASSSIPSIFNPSWQDFVTHVQSCSEVVLSAHLRRVSAKLFTNGELLLEAASFDEKTLNNSQTLESLKRCLQSYSGSDKWNIKIIKATDGAKPREQEAPLVVEGSLAHLDAVTKEEHLAQVDEEARSHPLVKAALNTFSGSKIEKVSALKGG